MPLPSEGPGYQRWPMLSLVPRCDARSTCIGGPFCHSHKGIQWKAAPPVPALREGSCEAGRAGSRRLRADTLPCPPRVRPIPSSGSPGWLQV